MKKLILYLILVLTAIQSNSHPIWNNTLTIGPALTANDTLRVSVRYRYIVAARMLYRDYCSQAKIANQQLFTIQQQDLQLKSLEKSNQSLEKANLECDSINKKNNVLLNQAEIQHAKDAYAISGNQAKKIGLGIAVPVVAVLGFLLGWFLHR